MQQASTAGRPAIVLGGGGVLGACQVGMMRALLEHGILPGLVVGTSVGAINGAALAADPTVDGAKKVAGLWSALAEDGMFGDMFTRAETLARSRTHLYSPAPLRGLVSAHVPATFADLKIPFQCVAASIERAGAHWFDSGSLQDAVMASAAVPGLLPPVQIDGEHFIDGGLVHPVPVGRAVALGACEIYVLDIGRAGQPLQPPKSLWNVFLTSIELSRRHRFVEEMANLPDQVRVHLLPTGEEKLPLLSMGTKSARKNGKAVAARIERGYQAAADYLATRARQA